MGIRVVGQQGIINGTMDDIVEYDAWVWRNNKPVEIVLRIEPDCYGGMPGHYEVGADGKPIYSVIFRDKTFSSRDALLAHRIKETEEAVARAKAGLKANRAELKRLRALSEIPSVVEAK